MFGYLKSNDVGINPILSNKYSPVVYYARSACLGGDVLRGVNQKPWDGKLPYEYLMWIDSDIVFDVESFMSLFNKMEKNPDLEVLSGVYLMENRVHTTVVKDWDIEFFKKNGSFQFLKMAELINHSASDPRGLIQVDYVGMGWMLMRRGVVEKLQYPWFKPHFHQIGDSYDFTSEDVGFCHDLKEKGVKIWVDPTIKVGHEKSLIL